MPITGRAHASKRSLRATSIVGALLAASWTGCSTGVSDSDRESTIRIGRQLVEGVSKFHRDNERFPRDLEELVPLYLERLPKAPGSKKWEYNVIRNGSDFEISVKFGPATIFYVGKHGRWFVDTG